MELSYIVLTAENPAEMRTWYSTRLGLNVILEKRDLVILGGKDGGAALEIRKGKPVGNPERVVLAFKVQDLSLSLKRLTDGKIPTKKKTERGRTVATLKDPAGHTVELFQTA